MREDYPEYLCPGPAPDGSPVWECHGAACPFHHDPEICRPEVEKRGYARLVLYLPPACLTTL